MSTRTTPMIFATIVCAIALSALSGCYGNHIERADDVGHANQQKLEIVEIYGNDTQILYVDRDTKVEYIGTRIEGTHGGSFGLSVRLDANGKPMIWEEELT